jgi:hypothetical protein
MSGELRGAVALRHVLAWVMLAATAFAFAPACRADTPALPELPLSKPFGIHLHYKAGFPELQEHIDYIKRAGYGYVRNDILWEEVERKSGQYDFSAYDRLVDGLGAAGIHVIFILAYANPLYDHKMSPKSAEARTAYAHFAGAAAAHYAGKGVVWEVYNEPDHGFWTPEPDVDQYIALANETTRAIRASDPQAFIVGPALSGPSSDKTALPKQLAFLDKVLGSEAARDWSAITVHPYRGSHETPETVVKALQPVREMVASHGLHVPVVIGEWGYSTWQRADPGTSLPLPEQMQAAYVTRSYFLASALRMPYSVIYELQNDAADASKTADNFGMLRSGTLAGASESDIAKPAYLAVSQTSRLLDGYRFDRVVSAESGVWVYHYLNEGREAYVVWDANGSSADPDAQARVTLALKPGTWCATTLLASAHCSAVDASKTLTLSATAMPTIVKPQ